MSQMTLARITKAQASLVARGDAYSAFTDGILLTSFDTLIDAGISEGSFLLLGFPPILGKSTQRPLL